MKHAVRFAALFALLDVWCSTLPPSSKHHRAGGVGFPCKILLDSAWST